MCRIQFKVFVLDSILFIVFVGSSKLEVCQVVLTNDFDLCNNRAAELADFANDEKNRVLNQSYIIGQTEACTYDRICRQVFKVARIRRQSFGAKTLVRISDMLYRCCGECAKYYRHDIHTQLTDLNLSVIEPFDIVYPVLGRSSHRELYGFHYIPVFQVPGGFYFTLGRSKEEMASVMIMSCLKLWPLFVSCLFLSFIAGFVAWILEAPFGNEEFPKSFVRGMYESFWWSFITMTTVGYGDKITKKPVGRLFSVIWILIGITVCSIFVASLSSEVMMFSTPVVPKMNGRTVGGLTHRLHDAIMVSQQGGIFRAIEFNSTITGVVELIEMLDGRKIDGFLISRSTYFYFSRVLGENSKYKNHATYVNGLNLIRTEIFFKDNQVVTGMLVKTEQHYEFFKRYFESNWLQIQACYSYSSNYKDKAFATKSFTGLDALFAPFLYWILAIVGAILLFGGVYELVRHFFKNSRVFSVPVDVINTRDIPI